MKHNLLTIDEVWDRVKLNKDFQAWELAKTELGPDAPVREVVILAQKIKETL